MRADNPDEWPEALALQGGLARLGAARAAADTAAEAARSARDAVISLLRQFANALLAEGITPPREVLRALYWDHPDVPVAAITRAFGFRETLDLIEFVGPDDRTELCIGNCGRTVAALRKHRTDANSNDWRRCPECAARAAQKTAQREAERLQRAHEEDRQHREMLEKLRADPPPVRRQYVEYEGVPGLWRIAGDHDPDWA